MNHLQEQTSFRYSNVGIKLTRVDNGEDFTTYEIFESQEALIKWTREVAMAQEFFCCQEIVSLKLEKNERVPLSCDREELTETKM